MNLVATTPTLITSTRDAQGRILSDLRISVTERCNFRCPHCMPEDRAQDQHSLVAPDDYLSITDIVRVARAATRLGVRKIRITGGEPLLRPGLTDLIAQITKIPGISDTALTTNGYLLSQSLEALKAAGLKRLTISLNSLDENIFYQMKGHRHSLQVVLEAIAHAHALGFSPLKINVVIQRHVNDHEILDFINYFRATPHILRFIEYMDVGTRNQWELGHVVFAHDIIERIHARYPLQALEPHHPGETAKRYRYKDGKGEVGFIASVSNPFCSACSRLRLTPDGKLFSCLFAHEGVDLKNILKDHQDDGMLLGAIKNTWQQRTDAYSLQRCHYLAKNTRNKKIEMYKIGG